MLMKKLWFSFLRPSWQKKNRKKHSEIDDSEYLGQKFHRTITKTQKRMNVVKEQHQSTNGSEKPLFHPSTQQLIDKRRLRLQQRVEQALKQVNSQFDVQNNDFSSLISSQQSSPSSENSTKINAILGDRLSNIQKQLEIIPRLSQSQFLEMPKEQREEYIRVIERLAAQSSIAMKLQQQQQQQSNFPISHLENSTTISPTPFSSQKQQQIQTDHRNAHYTIQAIELAAKREHELRMKKWEEIRSQIIARNFRAIWLYDLDERIKKSLPGKNRAVDEKNRQATVFASAEENVDTKKLENDTKNEYDDDNDRKQMMCQYASFVSVRRLLHWLKYKNVDEANKQKIVQFMREHCPFLIHMISFHFLSFSPLSSSSLVDSVDMDSKKLENGDETDETVKNEENAENNEDEKRENTMFFWGHDTMKAMSSESRAQFFDWITHATVIINDWLPKLMNANFNFYYPLEECLLYSMLYSDAQYRTVNRWQGQESSDMRK